LQYRVYLERPAIPQTYETLEMHYYHGICARPVMAWTFPKRDHLSIGLGVTAKISGADLRLFPGIPYRIRVEGNLLYGGAPRPRIATDTVMVGGTAAGLVDATTGEGIYEAASSGRLAAGAVAQARRGGVRSAGRTYERSLKAGFYGRMRDRHHLMAFLERKPRRFDVLFEQLTRTPRFSDMIQSDRDDYSLAQWIYLYAQMARFTVKAL
jgi:flavin-dependent dehydrogenase